MSFKMFAEIASAVAIGVAVPLLFFKIWLEERLNWYGGQTLEGLDKIHREI